MIFTAEATGVEDARMAYRTYEHDIVRKYSVELIGWTHHEFVSPSQFGSSVQPLQELFNALKNGRCYWKKLTAAQLKERIEGQNRSTTEGAVVAPALKRRKQRSDKGKKRAAKRPRRSHATEVFEEPGE